MLRKPSKNQNDGNSYVLLRMGRKWENRWDGKEKLSGAAPTIAAKAGGARPSLNCSPPLRADSSAVPKSLLLLLSLKQDLVSAKNMFPLLKHLRLFRLLFYLKMSRPVRRSSSSHMKHNLLLFHSWLFPTAQTPFERFAVGFELPWSVCSGLLRELHSLLCFECCTRVRADCYSFSKTRQFPPSCLLFLLKPALFQSFSSILQDSRTLVLNLKP